MQAHCCELGITSPKQICMMFDILVKPVLTYGCEVWGADLNLQDLNNGMKTQRDIETLHLDLLRWTLGVRRTTPSAHIRGKFGRHPICLFTLKMVVTFYERLLRMDGSRLLKLAFRHSIGLARQGQKSWASNVLGYLRAFDIESPQGCLKPDWLDLLSHASFSTWACIMKNGSIKNTTYFAIKRGLFEMASYLDQNLTRKSQIILAKFRTGSRYLAIETGRKNRMARDERVCPYCTTGIVEDERHFLFQCPAYDALWCQFKDLFLWFQPCPFLQTKWWLDCCLSACLCCTACLINRQSRQGLVL